MLRHSDSDLPSDTLSGHPEGGHSPSTSAVRKNYGTIAAPKLGSQPRSQTVATGEFKRLATLANDPKFKSLFRSRRTSDKQPIMGASTEDPNGAHAHLSSIGSWHSTESPPSDPATDQPTRTQRLKAYWKKTKNRLKYLFRLIVILGVLVGLTVLGGFIFQTLEVDNELVILRKRNAQVKIFIASICKNLEFVNATDENEFATCTESVRDTLIKWENPSDTDGEPTYLMESVFYMIDRFGVNSTNSKWNLWESSFLALTAYTTIGYGTLTPSTVNGRVAIIIYSTLMIPIFLYIIADIGLSLNQALRYFWARVTFLYGKCSKVHDEALSKNYATIKGFVKKTKKEPIPFVLAIICTYAYLLIGGLMFTLMLKWSYFDAFYYCFQTLCTIGFGDIVPDAQGGALTVVSMIYIIFGLAMVSMCFNALSEHVRKSYEQHMPNLMSSTVHSIKSLQQQFTQKELAEIWAKMSVASRRRSTDVLASPEGVAPAVFGDTMITTDEDEEGHHNPAFEAILEELDKELEIELPSEGDQPVELDPLQLPQLGSGRREINDLHVPSTSVIASTLPPTDADVNSQQ